ncbi:EthD family reductase [Bordetella genomosp. 11]|uniref:Ethyl tert-butyl ether degradation protein EthD n=1 Tax=Bordetella genomosp. 11 TaxID=1416808 RepID=A0A261UPY9_9BORD|nr:EthD family reductase [Bordetella genomosp. 11]OZI63432.1 ethyl tert-butyl ether degradation protein EthD [Bordetella genomosp. 11]
MNTEASPVVVYVTYRGLPQDRFDRDYYVEVHLPLVMKAWSQYGLLSLNAFFPATAQEGTQAICECLFRDEGALEAAFASPEVSAVMADVPRFTAIAPQRVRVAAL